MIRLSQDDEEAFRLYDALMHVVACAGLYRGHNVERAALRLEHEAAGYSPEESDSRALRFAARMLREAAELPEHAEAL